MIVTPDEPGMLSSWAGEYRGGSIVEELCTSVWLQLSYEVVVLDLAADRHLGQERGDWQCAITGSRPCLVQQVRGSRCRAVEDVDPADYAITHDAQSTLH